MNLLDQLAESRIREALSNGELENLAGSGQPLRLDSDEMVDPSLRVAYRILKNAGFVPAEVAQRQQIGSIEALLQQVSDPLKRKPLIDQLLQKMSELNGPIMMRADIRAHYYEQLLERLSTTKQQV